MRYLSFLSFLLTLALQAQPATQPANDSDDYSLTQIRVLTTREQTFFYKEVETTFDKLAQIAGPIIEDLDEALAKSGNRHEGAVTFIYLNATHDMSKPFKLQIGIPVQKDAVEFGDFKVRQLPSVKAATVLFGGSLQYVSKVYEITMGALAAKNLIPGEELRESYFVWEGADSPNNVTQIQIVLQP